MIAEDDHIREWIDAVRQWKADRESEAELRDHFAAAALTGLLVHANDGIDEETLDTPSDIAYTAYQMADAMLRERDKKSSAGASDAGVAPDATRQPFGLAPATDQERFNAAVMNWISEASTFLYHDVAGSDGGKQIIADVCQQCWTAYGKTSTIRDAAPAAKATADRYVRRAAADGDSDRTGKAAPLTSEGAGDTPVTEPMPVSGSGSATPVSYQKSDDQPVAWIAVFDGDDADGEFVWPNEGLAREWASSRPGVEIAPLYIRPQPTVNSAPATKSERVNLATANEFHAEIARLRGLLDRLKS